MNPPETDVATPNAGSLRVPRARPAHQEASDPPPAAVHRLQRLLQLPADTFPTLRALAGELVSVDFELSFEDGLRLLLQGISPASGPTSP